MGIHSIFITNYDIQITLVDPVMLLTDTLSGNCDTVSTRLSDHFPN